MNKSLNDAALDLYNSVSLPKGMFNVIPSVDPDGNHLIVWINKSYINQAHRIPREFEGFLVTVENMPNAFSI